MGYKAYEAATLLGIKVRTMRGWIHSGKIKAQKDGKFWIINQEEINRIKGASQENENKN